ncbi:hypothetical protein [Bacillus thuringiensis]|uniref:hypothetical protein n=1 Tax=Bacillus thuringiensis TaxID=1428 RepID=UPI0011A813CB|nr:hypothetical protein [Bacillus thuringiensis]
MGSIRIIAMPEKVDGLVKAIGNVYEVIFVSKQYAMRDSEEVRVYVKVIEKEGEKDGKNPWLE